MRTLLTILLILVVVNTGIVFAEGDLWDNFGDQNIYGQKPVSEKEFDNALKSKQKKKKKDKNIPKGESIQKSNETDELTDVSKELPILLVPLNLKISDDSILPVGHYQVEGVKQYGKVYLNLYQGPTLMAKLPAQETDDDFGEQNITFVKLLPHGDYHVKIIFGNLDFNAYSIIDTAQ